MTDTETGQREHLRKLVNGNISDSDTSLFDLMFSYEKEKPKSEEEKEAEFKHFIEKVNSKRQDAICLL